MSTVKLIIEGTGEKKISIHPSTIMNSGFQLWQVLLYTFTIFCQSLPVKKLYIDICGIQVDRSISI